MRFKANYRLVIGSAEIDTTKDVSASTLVRLDVAADIAAHTDAFVLHLAPLGGIQPALDEDATIEIGFDDKLTRVFTGKVTGVTPEISTVRISGQSTMLALEALRVDETFENMSAGEIVSRLAGDAGMNTGEIEDGIQLIVYAVDSRLSAARHIHRLAERCGFDAYTLPTGELEFRQFNKRSPDHVFKFGEDILDYSLALRSPAFAEVVVQGESPASSNGDDAASWLTKSFQKGQASGSGGAGTLLIEDPAIRTTEGANQRAQGALRRLRQRTVTGGLRALGRPEVRLGDAIRVESAPEQRLNSVFQVRAVRHHLSRRSGMVTEIDFWGLP
jgi:hypothetical protein